MKAYAWKSGRIDFGRKVPDGALEIGSASSKALRRVIDATARHGYDNSLIVPGVPEAQTGDAKVDALIAYCKWIKPRLEKVNHARH